MTSAETQLARIGFGTPPGRPDCWRVTRLEPSVLPVVEAEAAPDVVCSRALRRWRVLLARDCRPSPYRISRIEG